LRILKSALLYTALGLLANTAVADNAAIEALREGDMRKLNIHSEPMPGSDVTFVHEDGWATWCAPCRKEMPDLAELQTELSGDTFEVVTIATGRNPRPAMEAFFDEIGVDNLPLHTDSKTTTSPHALRGLKGRPTPAQAQNPRRRV